MEGTHVVVLQIDLDKGLPVVVALVHHHFVQHKTVKIQRRPRAHARQVSCYVAPVALKQQAVPLLQRVIFEVEAGVLLKMGCANQRTGLDRSATSVATAISPAVQGANDIATGAGYFAAVVGGGVQQ